MQARRRWQRPEQREVASVSASECGGVALASGIMWYADALVLVEMRVLYMYWLRACANCFSRHRSQKPFADLHVSYPYCILTTPCLQVAQCSACFPLSCHECAGRSHG